MAKLSPTGHLHRHRWMRKRHYWVCIDCRWWGGFGKRPRAAVGLPAAK